METRDFVLPEDADASHRKVHLRNAIVDHLHRNPLAGDTADGIVAAWLPSRGCEDAPHFITDIVATMVEAGELAARPLPDGRVLYVRGAALG